MPPAKRTTTAASKPAEPKDEVVKDESSAPKNEAPKVQDPKAPSTESESPLADTAAAKSDDKPKDDDTGKTSESKGDDEIENENARRGLSAGYDPVVVDDHAQASRAAQVSEGDIKKAARVQVRNFDTSDFGRSVMDAMSDSAKDKNKKSKDKK